MASKYSKSKDDGEIEICDPYNRTKIGDKRRTPHTRKMSKKKYCFSSDYIFVLKTCDGNWTSQDIGINKEIHKIDDTDAYNDYADNE